MGRNLSIFSTYKVGCDKMKIGLAQLICLILGVFLLSFGGGLYGGRLAAERQARTLRESTATSAAHSPNSVTTPATAVPQDQKKATPDLLLSLPAIPEKPQQNPPSAKNADSPRSPESQPSKTAGTRFMIQAISTSNQEDASNSRRQLMAEGFPAGIFEADLGERGKWYRVYIGPYDSEAEARLGLEAVQKIPGFEASFVKSLD
jgi:cell division protein FtsN